MSGSIRLNAIEKGSGQTLVLVPGWSQTAKFYQKQIDGLSDRYRVIAVDMRGHGDSPKPETGYRIARLAGDLHDFIVSRDLHDIALAGHSMGVSIIWSYLEQFGPDRVAKLIYIDQAPTVTIAVGLEGAALKDAGAVFTPEALYATAAAIAADPSAVVDSLKGAFFTPAISDADVAFNKAEALKMPPAAAARLLVDHCAQDWRDLIANYLPTLGKPTLVVGGALGTLFPPESQAWIAARIPGARLCMIEEGGSHFVFWENAEAFNAAVREFLG